LSSASIFPAATLLQSSPDGFALGDFWTLTQQAGPLRWPIFFVLAFGLIQVFLKLYELVRDRRVSAMLYATDFAAMSLEDIVGLVGRQEESMLSSLQSTMLNVFQTRPGEGLLHDEISNFVSFQQDQFGAFNRRMEFLSDTAGALGLMGTVWGMFTVFFQGTAEQDVILRGMGIALITTLLGLVVSLILNFSATELSTFFGKRIEHVSRKSDELRFRLMELAPKSGGVPSPPGAGVPAAAPVQPNPAPVSTPAVPKKSSAKAKTSPPEEVKPASPAWHYVELESGAGGGRAGAVLPDLGLMVKDVEGKPAADVAVIVTAAGTAGSLGDGDRSVRGTSNKAGRIGVACSLPEGTGPFALDVSFPGQAGSPTRLEVLVGAAEPHSVVIEGNNQAAVTGMKLPLPLGVRISDRFGNPVSEVAIDFEVTQGVGQLSSGQKRITVKTDSTGLASTLFVVSSHAGQNGVTASIDGSDHAVEFVAFGTQV
jgi:biopolymer transport protein ExbB/TolQ